MSKIIFFVLLLGFLSSSSAAYSAYDTSDRPEELKTQEKLIQFDIDRQFYELNRTLENQARQETIQRALDEAKREAQERADQIKQKAKEQAQYEAFQLLRSSIKLRNNMYIGVLLFLICSFVAHLISIEGKGKAMSENQKYGFIVMIVSFLLNILSIFMSDFYSIGMDLMENLMHNLELASFYSETISIVIRTKYVVLFFVSMGAYGLTTYLGITPALRPWKKFTTR